MKHFLSCSFLAIALCAALTTQAVERQQVKKEYQVKQTDLNCDAYTFNAVTDVTLKNVVEVSAVTLFAATSGFTINRSESFITQPVSIDVVPICEALDSKILNKIQNLTSKLITDTKKCMPDKIE